MKTRETVHADGNRLVVRRSFENDPYIERAAQLRAQHGGRQGESRLAGVIPVHLLAEWVKEAGLTFDDSEAVRDLVRRKILSGDFDKLRVWEGSF